MKFPKTQIKSTETQFENAKTQFQKCENSIYRGPTGVDWPRNALKKNPVTLIFGDVKWLITTVNDRPWTQITLLKGFGCFQ